jgi:2-polyprenyl-6-methoxyphenol hydroxylase-like FAD-dependent oxidoreductase
MAAGQGVNSGLEDVCALHCMRCQSVVDLTKQHHVYGHEQLLYVLTYTSTREQL